MSEDLRFRKANRDDAARIRDIHVEAIRVLCASHYRPEEIAAWTRDRGPETYREAIVGGLEALYVAERAGEVVGFSALATRELRALYVHPDWAGQGIGARLLRWTEGLARQQNMAHIYLDASLNAVRFYRAQGYEILRSSWVYLPDGTELPALRMKKVLRPVMSWRPRHSPGR